MAILGYQVVHGGSSAAGELAIADLREETAKQGEGLDGLKLRAEQTLQALTLRVAELQARLVRLDAMGERLTTMAGLDSGEFDFSKQPALGGPEDIDLGLAYTDGDLGSEIDRLDAVIADREQQLRVLEDLLANRQLADEVYLAGRPIVKGWQSSAFGRRTDPFSGRAGWHSGIDFAGKENSEIIAVASGVVTWSGARSGYGQMVEVNHGSGYTTRYSTTRKTWSRLEISSNKARKSLLWATQGGQPDLMSILRFTSMVGR